MNIYSYHKRLHDLSYNSYTLANGIMSDLYMNLKLTNKIKENVEEDKKIINDYVKSLYNSGSAQNISYKISNSYKSLYCSKYSRAI